VSIIAAIPATKQNTGSTSDLVLAIGLIHFKIYHWYCGCTCEFGHHGEDVLVMQIELKRELC
jgi:hypothetical protein